MDLAKTSWGLQLAGALKHVLNIRKDASVKRMKEVAEYQEKNKSVTSKCFTRLCGCLYYIIILVLIVGFVVPFATMHYVKNEIRQGHWENVNKPVNLTDIDISSFQKPKTNVQNLKKKQEEMVEQLK